MGWWIEAFSMTLCPSLEEEAWQVDIWTVCYCKFQILWLSLTQLLGVYLEFRWKVNQYITASFHLVPTPALKIHFIQTQRETSLNKMAKVNEWCSQIWKKKSQLETILKYFVASHVNISLLKWHITNLMLWAVLRLSFNKL